MILTEDSLLEQLGKLTKTANGIDVAVAWASPGKALAQIAEFGRGNPDKLRSIVGISGSATDPIALRDLAAAGALRIPDITPLFHPKLFIFHREDGATAWLGSANLTNRGFSLNRELVYQFEDGAREGQLSIRHWFNTLWKSLNKDPWPCIKWYEKYRPDMVQKPQRSPSLVQAPKKSAFYKLAAGLNSWRSFVEAIEEADRYWSDQYPFSVLGESASWLNTISAGHALMKRTTWDNLTEREYRLLMGISTKSDPSTSGFGLLGSMQAAGIAKNVFRSSTPATNLGVRRKILRALQPVMSASEVKFPDQAEQFIRSVNSHDGFSGAIATRLLTLARPDLAISINNGSRQRLSELTGLAKSSLGNAPAATARTSYSKVLNFFRNKKWYASPNPKNAYEETLADARGALFDALIYLP